MLIAVMLVSACATSGTAPVSHHDVTAASALEWRAGDVMDYESRAPGLGKSYRYDSVIGWIDVYLYTLNRSDWGNGVTAKNFADHFDSTIAEVRAAERQGIYQGVVMVSLGDEEIAGQTFRHAKLSFMIRDKRIESHIFLTAVNGSLLKFRMSFFEPFPTNLQGEIDSFVLDILRKLGLSQSI